MQRYNHIAAVLVLIIGLYVCLCFGQPQPPGPPGVPLAPPGVTHFDNPSDFIGFKNGVYRGAGQCRASSNCCCIQGNVSVEADFDRAILKVHANTDGGPGCKGQRVIDANFTIKDLTTAVWAPFPGVSFTLKSNTDYSSISMSQPGSTSCRNIIRRVSGTALKRGPNGQVIEEDIRSVVINVDKNGPAAAGIRAAAPTTTTARTLSASPQQQQQQQHNINTFSHHHHTNNNNGQYMMGTFSTPQYYQTQHQQQQQQYQTFGMPQHQQQQQYASYQTFNIPQQQQRQRPQQYQTFNLPQQQQQPHYGHITFSSSPNQNIFGTMQVNTDQQQQPERSNLFNTLQNPAALADIRSHDGSALDIGRIERDINDRSSSSSSTTPPPTEQPSPNPNDVAHTRGPRLDPRVRTDAPPSLGLANGSTPSPSSGSSSSSSSSSIASSSSSSSNNNTTGGISNWTAADKALWKKNQDAWFNSNEFVEWQKHLEICQSLIAGRTITTTDHDPHHHCDLAAAGTAYHKYVVAQGPENLRQSSNFDGDRYQTWTEERAERISQWRQKHPDQYKLWTDKMSGVQKANDKAAVATGHGVRPVGNTNNRRTTNNNVGADLEVVERIRPTTLSSSRHTMNSRVVTGRVLNHDSRQHHVPGHGQRTRQFGTQKYTAFKDMGPVY